MDNKIVSEAIKSTALKKSPFNINKLLIKSKTPINIISCKGSWIENRKHRREIDEIKSMKPRIFTSTIIF